MKFSPDNEHYAFVNSAGGVGEGTLFVDGVKQAGSYRDAAQLTRANGGFWPTFEWSPDSKHIAWYGNSPADTTGSGVFVDGKFFRASENGIPVFHVMFTPDSKHVIYASLLHGGADPQYGVFVDGKLAVQFDMNGSLMSSESSFHFNEDGTLDVFGQDEKGLERFRITMPGDTSVATITGGASLLAKNN